MEMNKELKDRLILALNKMDTYQRILDNDSDAMDFHQTSRYNYYSLIITMIYLKLEEDGYLPQVTDKLDLKEDKYNYIPFGKADIDVDDAPKCALVKRAFLDAGFEFPREVNFLDEEARSFTGYGYSNVYSPSIGTPYSVHHDDAADVSTAAITMALDNLIGFDDDGNEEFLRVLSFLNGDIDEVTTDEGDELDIDDAKRYLADNSALPLAFFGLRHKRWAFVRKQYGELLKEEKLEASGFPTEEYLKIDREVSRLEEVGLPYGLWGAFASTVTLDDGTTATVNSIPDVNDAEDGGYGHTYFFMNPLSFFAPDCVLTLPDLKKDIDTFCEKYSTVLTYV